MFTICFLGTYLQDQACDSISYYYGLVTKIPSDKFKGYKSLTFIWFQAPALKNAGPRGRIQKTLKRREKIAGENPKGNKEIWESRERCRLLSLRNKHNK